MKISNLPSAEIPLSGEEFLVLTQNGKSVRVQAMRLMGGDVDSVNGQTGEVVLTAIDVGAVESVNGKTGIVILSPEDVGADPTGTALTVATDKLNVHVANANPHTQYVLTTVGDVRYIRRVEIGAPNGVAGLDETGKIPAALIPNLPGARKVVVADENERYALSVYGDLTIAYQADNGTTWALGGGQNPANVDNWTQLGEVLSNVVNSFNARTGNVVPMAGDYTTDQITEATKKFVTDAEKTTWNNKQNTLVSTVNVKTVGGKTIVGSGDAGIVPSDIGAAPATHTHTSSNITDFGDSVGTEINQKLVAGSNVTLNFNNTTKATTISVPNDKVSSVNGEVGDVTLTAAKVGAAPATHTHTSSDITDFDSAVAESVGSHVVAGSGVSVVYDPVTGDTTVSSDSTSSVSSVNGKTGIVVLTATDVGADPAGSAVTVSQDAIDLHEAEVDPHPQYLTKSEGDAFYVTNGELDNTVKDVIGSTIVTSGGLTGSYDPVSKLYTLDGSALTPTVTSVNQKQGIVNLTKEDLKASGEFVSTGVVTSGAMETHVFKLPFAQTEYKLSAHALMSDTGATGAREPIMVFDPNKPELTNKTGFLKFDDGLKPLLGEQLTLVSDGTFFNAFPKTAKNTRFVSTNKMLLKSVLTGAYYTITSGLVESVIAPQTETDFDAYGFTDSDFVMGEELFPLAPIAIVTFGSGVVDVEYDIDNQLIMNATPLDLSVYETITMVDVDATMTGTADIKFAVSVDGGVDWVAYDGASWNSLGAVYATTFGANTVIASGMSLMELGTYVPELEVLADSGNGTLKVAMAISIPNRNTDMVHVTGAAIEGNYKPSLTPATPSDVKIRWYEDRVTFTTTNAGSYVFVYQPM